jgi:hypothetical protein
VRNLTLTLFPFYLGGVEQEMNEIFLYKQVEKYWPLMRLILSLIFIEFISDKFPPWAQSNNRIGREHKSGNWCVTLVDGNHRQMLSDLPFSVALSIT